MNNKKLSEENEAYGEPLNETLAQIPKWHLRWGTTIIFLVIIGASFLSFVIKYPDIILSEIYITTTTPPVGLIAKVNGKLIHLRANMNERVKKDEVIAIIENAALYEDVKQLNLLIDDFRLESPIKLDANLQLGTIQDSYSKFKEAVEEYYLQLDVNPEFKELLAVRNQIQKHKESLHTQKLQKELFHKELELITKDYKRTQKLFKAKVIPAQEWERKEKELIENTRNYEKLSESISNTKIMMASLKKEIIILSVNDKVTRHQLSLRVQKAFENLKNEIKNWQQKYIIKSPIEGKITFFNYWADNQSVKSGEEIFSVIPLASHKIIGKVRMPIKNSGKVKPGNKVIVKLNNYPYTEFGLLIGVVKTISLTPRDGYYFIEIQFPNSLITTSNFSLPLRQEMEGTAEIVTEDLRLIERIFYQLRGLFGN